MPKEEIRAIVERALREIDSLEHRTSFLDTDDLTVDYGLDSLDVIELMMFLEDKLDEALYDKRAMEARTVGDLVAMCEDLLSE